MSTSWSTTISVRKLADTVSTYAGATLPDRLAPDRLKQAALRTLARHARLLDDLPVGISRALRRASEGEFRLAVRPSEYDRFLDRVSDLAVRLSLSVLLAAFVVGFSVIVALQPDNRAVNATAEVVLVVATVVATWWMTSLVLGYRRRKR